MKSDVLRATRWAVGKDYESIAMFAPYEVSDDLTKLLRPGSLALGFSALKELAPAKWQTKARATLTTADDTPMLIVRPFVPSFEWTKLELAR